ncbi:uncharacterized protein LOC113315575 [Papaver somniferum]|uniref:uncharacterized protein LOC113315575 n=1 Tax=Papaver somniferum TaxID=3469 RepID=UPI000E705245|nr:uncharacterized protein LOC113315575 [Papaver somniferum]
MAYVKGRCIQDQILLASELVNEMPKKRRCGNVALKLDISQAYDSVSWEFLFQVLQKIGFSKNWCDWLHILFKSAKISVIVNGGPCGFFSVGRGLRQGDPLSPILFVLMEEVLSKGITQMVNEGLIVSMVERKGIHPTHLFFADDVFIFWNGAKKSILSLMRLLEDYQKCSRQIINRHKSKMFIDGASELRKLQIKEIIQMEISSFPDKYLGVMLIIGRVKVYTVWPMVEMMQKKLATWKDDWEKFFQAKYKDKNGQWSTKWQKSSIWPGLKWAWEAFKEDIRWNVGDGARISVWFDLWIGDCRLIDKFGNNTYISENINLKVYDILINGEWSLTDELQQLLHNIKMPEVQGGKDILIWTRNLKGKFSIPKAVNKLRHIETSVSWYRYIWNSFLHPSVANNVWNLIQGIYTDDTVMIKNGYDMVSRCCICETDQDSMHHLLWECSFSVENYDQEIIARFQLGIRRSKFQCIKKCNWFPPEQSFIMLCCDGSSFGNPGSVGFGVVVRDSRCQVVRTLAGGIGVASNYLAEAYGVMCALELEIQWCMFKVIVVSDSKTVLADFAQGKIPWFLQGRWKITMQKISEIRYQHCYREVNFSADCTAKRGASLAAGTRQLHVGRPNWLPRIEMPNVDYYRFS